MLETMHRHACCAIALALAAALPCQQFGRTTSVHARNLLPAIHEIRHAAAADIDGDGDRDLISSSGRLFRRESNGYRESLLLPTPITGHPEARFVDLEGDRDTDFNDADSCFGCVVGFVYDCASDLLLCYVDVLLC